MKLSDINLLPTDDHMPAARQGLRKNAAKLIASVINDSRSLPSIRSLEDLRPEHVKPLSGGKDAVAYLINHPDVRVIIKIGIEGIQAEAETISAWKKRSVRVPAVIKTGIVPATNDTKHPVRYLVQEAMIDTNGRIIETCADYLTHDPSHARQVGQQLGKELNKIHSCISTRKFGEFSDSHGSSSDYASWNGYIADCIRLQESYLRNIGVTKDEINAVITTIEALRYVKQGRYLHGDFSIRNVAIKQRDPLKVSVFDPNPIIGDPTWDISFLVNNYEYEKRHAELDDTRRDLYVVQQQLWIGFCQRYKRRIQKMSMTSAQLVQAVYNAQYAESKDDKIAIRVRHEFIKDLIAQLLRE
jgi:fructosamine-3-kinase